MDDLTPGTLAVLSIAVGISPLLVAVAGSAMAKACGGTIDARGPQNCFILGIDIGPVLYAMFMCHWLLLITGGIAVWGLLISGVWALW